MQKQEILNQIDTAILAAPVSKPYQYVPEYDKEGDLTLRGKTEPFQLMHYHNSNLEKQGQVEFKYNKGSFKVLNDKEHLKKFRIKVDKNWSDKSKDIPPIKLRRLPSVVSCVLNMLMDTEHHYDDPRGYAENIFSVHQLTRLIFFVRASAVTPWLIVDNIIIRDREMLVVRGIKGWNVVDKKTAFTVTNTQGVKDDVFKSKSKVVAHATKSLKEFNFNIYKIKKLEVKNTQLNLEKQYCEENNIRMNEMNFL